MHHHSTPMTHFHFIEIGCVMGGGVSNPYHYPNKNVGKKKDRHMDIATQV